MPSRDDRHLFEHLVLEGAQAGLSWELILTKRDGYRRLFASFDIERVAGFDDARIDELAMDSSIIRNRRKIVSAISNARAAVNVRDEFGSLSDFMWTLAGGRTHHNAWTDVADIPAQTAESERISRELAHRGFKFVGPVGIYSFMQAVGMINDHLVTCPRHDLIRKLAP